MCSVPGAYDDRKRWTAYIEQDNDISTLQTLFLILFFTFLQDFNFSLSLHDSVFHLPMNLSYLVFHLYSIFSTFLWDFDSSHSSWFCFPPSYEISTPHTLPDSLFHLPLNFSSSHFSWFYFPPSYEISTPRTLPDSVLHSLWISAHQTFILIVFFHTPMNFQLFTLILIPFSTFLWNFNSSSSLSDYIFYLPRNFNASLSSWFYFFNLPMTWISLREEY